MYQVGDELTETATGRDCTVMAVIGSMVVLEYSDGERITVGVSELDERFDVMPF